MNWRSQVDKYKNLNAQTNLYAHKTSSKHVSPNSIQSFNSRSTNHVDMEHSVAYVSFFTTLLE